MPIDTRAKRQNAAQIGCPLPVSILPAGTIDAPARAQISWTYRGISISPPAAVTAPDRKIIVGGIEDMATGNLHTSIGGNFF